MLYQRFKCINTGRTVSVHPLFSQFRKRYALRFYLLAAGLLSEQTESIRSTSQKLNTSRSNVSQWRRRLFRNNESAKWACFYHAGLPHPITLKQLLFSVFNRSLEV
ncbi:hypothetical protein CHISP_2422 [Chitinispirillum alkaliphilum]|nr:hypothetical protein CHISP_2422 [Chitinispirillum alkaliphilum]